MRSDADADAPETFGIETGPGSGPEPAARDGLKKVVNFDSEGGAGHVAG